MRSEPPAAQQADASGEGAPVEIGSEGSNEDLAHVVESAKVLGVGGDEPAARAESPVAEQPAEQEKLPEKGPGKAGAEQSAEAEELPEKSLEPSEPLTRWDHLWLALWSGPRLQLSDDEQFGANRRRGPPRWWQLWATREDYFRRQEELTWVISDPDLRNLSFLLRAKHAESSSNASYHRALGLLVTLAGVLSACFSIGVAFCGWQEILAVAKFGLNDAQKPASGAAALLDVAPGVSATPPVIPPNLWQLVVATSGAVLLVIGTATLLFRVAAESFRRADVHAGAADQTRRIQVALRMLLSKASVSDDVGKSLLRAAARLLKEPTTPSTIDSGASLTAVPDILRELADLAAAVARAKPGKEKE